MYIMANVAIGPPYAINVSVVAEVYYKVQLDFWFELVLVLATQVTGFGLAGLCRRFLVWPASMVWPQNLVACTLLNTLHAEEEEEGQGISRFRYFMWVFVSVFFFYFLPGKSLVSLVNSLLIVARFSIHGIICLLLGLLDCAKERGG